MDATRRTLLAAGALAAVGVRPAAIAQAPARTFVAGQHYGVLNPSLPVDAPAGKIEVLEFFWYGCIHCYNLEPAVHAWLKALAPDVAFRYVPAVFNDRWAHDARIFYAFEALGAGPKVHRPLFDAIHKEKLDTAKQEAFNAFLGKAGIDARKFDEAFRSFGVQSKMRRAAQMTQAYRVDGTPSLAVHGVYTVSADQGGTAQGMFAIVDHLVDIVRKSKGTAPQA